MKKIIDKYPLKFFFKKDLREIDYQIAEKFKKWRIEPLSNWPDCYPFRKDRTEKYRIVKWVEDPEDPVCRMINENGKTGDENGCTEIPRFSMSDYASLKLLDEIAEKNSVSLYSEKIKIYNEYYDFNVVAWRLKINLNETISATSRPLTICQNILQAIELKTLVT